MREILFIIFIIVIGIFEVTLLDYFKLWGVKPDLLLIAMVFASLNCDIFAARKPHPLLRLRLGRVLSLPKGKVEGSAWGKDTLLGIRLSRPEDLALGSRSPDFTWGLSLGIFAGFFKDVFAAHTFGVNTILFSLWSFSIAELTKKISIDSNLRGISLVFILSLAHNVASGLITIYSGALFPAGVFLRIVFIGAIYTALMVPVVAWIGKIRFS